jgi:hypothetical protein
MRLYINHKQSFSFIDDYHNRDNNIDSSEINDFSTEINRKTSSVFYCYQENFHQTLIDGTLNEQGFGKCNIFNRIVTCPIEIECQISEADDCCEGNYNLTSSSYINQYKNINL